MREERAIDGEKPTGAERAMQVEKPTSNERR